MLEKTAASCPPHGMTHERILEPLDDWFPRIPRVGSFDDVVAMGRPTGHPDSIRTCNVDIVQPVEQFHQETRLERRQSHVLLDTEVNTVGAQYGAERHQNHRAIRIVAKNAFGRWAIRVHDVVLEVFGECFFRTLFVPYESIFFQQRDAKIIVTGCV